MNASIILDNPGNVSFTNLDRISGRLIVKSSKKLDLDSIVVKLEGESRTRLLTPAGPGEKQKPQLEYHRILYRVQLVFPPQEVLRNRANYGVAKNALTLPPGTHEYPFGFKIPFNNACAQDQPQTPTVNVSGSGVEFSKAPSQHVKKTLPPTLSGFPGEAEIRYFVKATISRHYFWKENPRLYATFNFFPIEPPRPPTSGSEVFARQKHLFTEFPDGANGMKSKMKIPFTKTKEPTSPTVGGEAPNISIDARLPEPAILTCNEDIPLRLIVKKLNDCNAMIFLQSLQISLIGSTKIRAHDVYRTESNSWVIMSKSNMGIPVGAASDPIDTESVIDDRMWRGLALPNTVAPSFLTCNIERAYQLDVRIGFSYTSATQGASKPQTVILPLRLDVEVYSGIAPPKELLEAMAEAKASIRRRSTADKSSAPAGKLQTDLRKDSTYSIPPTPMEPTGASGIPEVPAQEGTREPPPAPAYTDAPPSYEDAVATDLPPVDARRPDYAPPPAEEDDVLRRDEKKGFGRN